jgi:hypothetical protein
MQTTSFRVSNNKFKTYTLKTNISSRLGPSDRSLNATSTTCRFLDILFFVVPTSAIIITNVSF